MKFPFLAFAMMLAVTAWSPHAAAQTPYVSIEDRLTAEQLRSVGLTGEQLDKLNRMLRDAQRQADAPVAGAAVPAATADAAAQAGTASTTPVAKDVAPARIDDRGRDEGSLIGFNDKPIQSRLKGSISGWEPGTVFELENGQQWKVLKGALKLPRTLEAPEIAVVPGVAGRWFLQVVEGMPKARVYRID